MNVSPLWTAGKGPLAACLMINLMESLLDKQYLGTGRI